MAYGDAGGLRSCSPTHARAGLQVLAHTAEPPSGSTSKEGACRVLQQWPQTRTSVREAGLLTVVQPEDYRVVVGPPFTTVNLASESVDTGRVGFRV